MTGKNISELGYAGLILQLAILSVVMCMDPSMLETIDYAVLIFNLVINVIGIIVGHMLTYRYGNRVFWRIG